MFQNLILSSLFMFASVVSMASESSDLLTRKISEALKGKTPYAEIRLPNLDKLSRNPDIESLGIISQVRVVEERFNGTALLELISNGGDSIKIQTPYQALAQVPVAVQRIYPNTRLKKEDFRVETVDVANGPARNYRGAIVFDLERLSQSETKQSILDGQFVLSNQIQKTPDIRKGETIQVEIISGDLSLSTAATVLESGSIGESVRVLTNKTKKEISGKIRIDRSVEVKI